MKFRPLVFTALLAIALGGCISTPSAAPRQEAASITDLATDPAADPTAAQTPGVVVDRFAGRPDARIAFAREVRNFQVKREQGDDVIFLETRRDKWFRGKISCFGIADPRDALGFAPIDRTSGIDRFSRILLVGFGRDKVECSMLSLIELTPAEAIEYKLVRAKATRQAKSGT